MPHSALKASIHLFSPLSATSFGLPTPTETSRRRPRPRPSLADRVDPPSAGPLLSGFFGGFNNLTPANDTFVEDYLKAKSAIKPPFPAIDSLSYNDRLLIKTKFIDLGMSQKFVYFNLTDHLHKYVDEILGAPANFNALHVDGVWNWCSWHHAILGLVQRLDNPQAVENSQDCFFISLYPSQLTEDGRYRAGIPILNFASADFPVGRPSKGTIELF